MSFFVNHIVFNSCKNLPKVCVLNAAGPRKFFNLIFQFDPLAEFADMENAALDFESWEAKKLKIFAMF